LTATVAEGFMDFTLWERPRIARVYAKG
jgi:hypothetical protein